MYTTDQEGYQSPVNFAKTYSPSSQRKRRQNGVSRKYVYDLIEKEKATPGSTDLDVFEIDSRLFVRLRKKASS